MNQYFFEAFDDLFRMSPGSALTTTLASRPIPKDKEVSLLDVGCGRGMSTLLMAKEFPKMRTVAVDNNPDFIKFLKEKAKLNKLDKQIKAVVMDMNTLDFPEGQFDFIYAEGSVYVKGFESALADWKKFLHPEGRMIVNDLCWIHGNPEAVAVEKVEKTFGKLYTIEEKIAQVQANGFEVLGKFTQPYDDWMGNYYGPLMKNLDAMREKYEGKNPEAMEVVETLEKEILLYGMYHPYYSYVTFVLKFPDGN